MTYTKRNDWPQIIADFKASGMSQADYTKAHGLGRSVLSWQLNKEKYMAQRKLAAMGKKRGRPAKVQTNGHFVQVNGADANWIKVEGKGGVVIKLPMSADAEVLRRVVEVCHERNS